MNLKQIQKPIINEMDDFKSMLRSSISSDNILIDKVVNYILKRKGKQIRPLFVFLSAGLSGTISNSTYRAAILIEILHTATLIHDDVVDESNYRRGFFSVNALWKSKYSVLLGDYLLSKGLELSVNNNDFKFLGILSEAVKNMSEGEITQLKKSKTLNINEKDYFKVINQKTASLFSSCCEMGSLSSGTNKTNILLMREFGSLVGQAFQIRDDLFGYLSHDIGKPSLNDFKQRKMTLPLIYALSESNAFEKREILKNVKNFKSVEKIISFVKEKNGIAYSENKMNAMIIKSKKILNSFPDSVYKESINNLLDYTISRVK
ncbi:MAG TPA: polyprenyl synthetase family protein [Cytophagales bacterium]|jgi:octaprenyl-diphosphate synthase|nr:polyprenyl synthetase family protein [Cytophagales bacterium]